MPSKPLANEGVSPIAILLQIDIRSATKLAIAAGGALGLIAGQLSAYLYNTTAKRIGGIRINLK